MKNKILAILITGFTLGAANTANAAAHSANAANAAKAVNAADTAIQESVENRENAVNTANTATAENTESLTSHFYFGVDVGAANLMDKESHSVNPESHQLGALDAVAGIYAGYDFFTACRYRIAAEVFLDDTWMQTQIQHGNNTYSMNQLSNFGVRLVPAYEFTSNTFGHVILGYANGRFKIRDNGVYGFISSSYNVSGFQTGVGFDTALINNFFIRLDALYNIYGDKTSHGAGLTPGSSQHYTNRFSQLGGELSVFYRFE